MAPRDWTAWPLYGNSWLLHRKQSLLIRDSKPLPLFFSVLFLYVTQSSWGLFSLSEFHPLTCYSRVHASRAGGEGAGRAGRDPEGPFCSCAAAPKGHGTQGHRVSLEGTFAGRFTAIRQWTWHLAFYFSLILWACSQVSQFKKEFLFLVLLMFITPPAFFVTVRFYRWVRC